MTSALRRRQANEDDTLWRHNEPVIRQLYQEEKKTLRQVKEIMENEQGFPVTPLSIWEVKLRGLRMQKKLKARDWSLVYQHVRPRLQHEGKKKLVKPTAFLINGTQKSWDDVWKEIRRNCALGRGPHRGPLRPLPHGIVIRAPSPELIETTLRRQQSKSTHSLILQLFQTTLVSLQPLLESDSQSKPELSDTLKYSGSVYRLCLEGVPFTILFEKIPDTIQEALPSLPTVSRIEESQDERIASACNTSDNVAVVGHVTSWRSHLSGIIAQLLPESDSASPSGKDLRSNFDTHHYLSMVIYLLSNDFVRRRDSSPHEVSLFDILQMTFLFVSRRFLLAMFQSRLPSIKAGWEKLLLGAQMLENEDAFRFLIIVGMDNDWLDEQSKGHEYLFSATQMNCSDILLALLARGCRLNSDPSWCGRESVIVKALGNGNLDCAKLLIQHCDANREFQPDLYIPKSTIFLKFVLSFDDTKPDHLDCLKLFLQQGADVDYEIDPSHSMKRIGVDSSWYEALREWPLSILDYIYYFHRPLYPKLAAYSGAPSRFSRARALRHLEQSVNSLRDYLTSDINFAKPWGEAIGNDTNRTNVSERMNRCLEVLLVEQLLLSAWSPHRKVCWRTMQGLLELEVDVTWLSRTEFISAKMLRVMASFITSGERSDQEHGSQLLHWLLNHGFQVKANALFATICDHEVAVLEFLASVCYDLEKEGGEALVQVVHRSDFDGDFDAIKLVLDPGVDPTHTIDQYDNSFETAPSGSTFAMMRYLVQRGTSLRIWEQVRQSFDFLVDIIRMYYHRNMHVLFHTIQYIVEKHITISDPSFPSANLLEACVAGEDQTTEGNRTIFEFLWKKGAKLSPGSPLAVWIGAGGGHQLVEEMLDVGADPNAHSFHTNSEFIYLTERRQTPLQAAAGIGDYTLVCMLLERGADLNGPALGKFSKTALQEICAWDPVRREERMRKTKIIELFLDQGVDVNAANPAGHTALMYAAQLGDSSTAFNLLKHGAKVNAISWWHRNWDVRKSEETTALDIAAEHGRLDMVMFLLNANAVSSSAFSDGKDYDRAMQLARAEGHLVVSELICKHSVDRQRWDVSHGQVVETGVLPESTRQSLSLRAKPGRASWSQTERRLIPGENIQGVAVVDNTNDLCYTLDEGMIESSTAASKAKGKSMPGPEATDVSLSRVIEEIEDEAPLADTGRENPNGEKSDGTATQVFDTREATPGSRGWLYQARENWVEDEQQRLDPLVSSSLSTDVFMGFSEFPNP